MSQAARVGSLCALVVAASASAVDRVWTGLGDGISFSDRLNWLPNGVPGPADRAIFSTLGGPVNFPGGSVSNQGLTVGSAVPGVDFNLAGGAYQLFSPATSGPMRSLLIGQSAGDFAFWSVAGGIVLGNSGAVGVDFGSFGSVTMGTGMVVSFSGALNVGEAGIGELTLAGQMLSATSTIGQSITGFGTVSIDRSAGIWLLFGDLTIAEEGIGDVSVINSGSIVASEMLRVGRQPGSSGILFISDPGSFVLATEGADISGDANGPGGSAVVSVESGSLFRVPATLRINSEGDLSIFSARVEAAELILDGGSIDLQSNGTLLISEGGVRLDPGVFVGLTNQPGTLIIRNGGTLGAGPGFFGDEPNAGGNVLIEGPGSSALFVGPLVVGSVPSLTGGVGAPIEVVIADAGTLESTGSFQLRQRGRLTFEGGSLSAATVDLSDFGLVTIPLIPGPIPPPAIVATGPSTVGGGLIAVAPGANPTLGTAFDVLRAPSIDGTPAVLSSPLLPVFRYLSLATVPVSGGEALRAKVVYLPVFLRLGPPTTSTLERPPTAVAVAQFTPSPAPDAIVTQAGLSKNSPGQVQLLVSEVVNPGNAPTFVVAATVEVGAEPISVAQGELFGSGKPDAVTSNRGDGTLSLLRNTSTLVAGEGGGQAGIELEGTLLVGGVLGGVAVADLDGDRVNDIVVAQTSGDALVIFFNDGQGNFGAPVQLATGATPQTVCPIDLGGDRDNDLLVVNFGVAKPLGAQDAPSIAVHLNLGGGNFAPPAFYGVGAGPIGMGAGDLDGDGTIDVVTANSLAGTISVLVGLPDGTFLPAVDLDAGGFPTAIAVGDFDNDASGDLDIAVIVEDDMGVPSLTLFRNDSNGGQLVLTTIFDAQTIFGIPSALASANADLDGPVDLVSVGGGGGLAGPGGFISVFVADPVSCPGDVDGDGIVDGNDLGGLLAAWGDRGESPYDLNFDGIVNGEDLAILLADWGPCLDSRRGGFDDAALASLDGPLSAILRQILGGPPSTAGRPAGGATGSSVPTHPQPAPPKASPPSANPPADPSLGDVGTSALK
ncbi:MAG TPA: FG-GAP-like repeat-containing protein [Phycisphaerales bacterium]|nr:FG-GAP-like repeat-containing protein [Phycisphaerales bacterium]HMP37894.1 FG-GAP-like repeat-containing protein [Phycisphaerales bacterium]